VGQLAAQFFWGGLVGTLIDQRMLHGRQPAAHPLAALQQRQPLPGGQRLEVQPEHPFDGGVQGIESCRDRVSIHDSARTHTVKLAWATDKKHRPKTTETTVAQEVSANRRAARIPKFNPENMIRLGTSSPRTLGCRRAAIRRHARRWITVWRQSTESDPAVACNGFAALTDISGISRS
jgi:hypothetical protein